jgi:hypothetical protein
MHLRQHEVMVSPYTHLEAKEELIASTTPFAFAQHLANMPVEYSGSMLLLVSISNVWIMLWQLSSRIWRELLRISLKPSFYLRKTWLQGPQRPL